MNAKSKIRIYQKIIEEVCREYNGGHEFVVNKVKELLQLDSNPQPLSSYNIYEGVSEQLKRRIVSFFNQSKKAAECHVSFTLLAYAQICTDLLC